MSIGAFLKNRSAKTPWLSMCLVKVGAKVVAKAIIITFLLYLPLAIINPFNQSFAQSHFPPLTQRIVDNAHLLDQKTKQNLSTILAQQEQKSGDQIVVATVPSLNGQDIESTSNALFRHWQLGQSQQNNGVLFLIAPNERAVRIEVGYGLEGVLTDATASVIINSLVLPKFRDNQYQEGIIAGTNAILAVVSGEKGELLSRIKENEARIKKEKAAQQRNDFIINIIVMLFILGFFFIPRKWINWRGGGGFGGGGFGGGGSSGGGFSGGGGSSGGGGASGRW